MPIKLLLIFFSIILFINKDSFGQSESADSIRHKLWKSIWIKTDSLEKAIFGYDLVESNNPIIDLSITFDKIKFGNFVRKSNKGVTYYKFDRFYLTDNYSNSIELLVYNNELLKVIEANGIRKLLLDNNQLFSILTPHGLSLPDEWDCIVEEELPIYFNLLNTLRDTKFR